MFLLRREPLVQASMNKRRSVYMCGFSMATYVISTYVQTCLSPWNTGTSLNKKEVCLHVRFVTMATRAIYMFRACLSPWNAGTNLNKKLMLSLFCMCDLLAWLIGTISWTKNDLFTIFKFDFLFWVNSQLFQRAFYERYPSAFSQNGWSVCSVTRLGDILQFFATNFQAKSNLNIRWPFGLFLKCPLK